MICGYKYIQVNNNGRVCCFCDNPVFVNDVEITIDINGMIVPEKPMDAIYDLYYNKEYGLYYVKVADLKSKPTQLDRIESMVAKSQEEIAQEARDAYTLELIEGGVIA